jgi:hypothetical protein
MIKLLSGLRRGRGAGPVPASPQMSRRMVLMGAGGLALAVPFLPSLLEGSAKASGTAARPRLFWFGTDHGGCWDQNFYPSSPSLTQQATAFSGHTVNAGALAGTTSGSTTSISPVLSASSSTLTSGLMKKLNVLRGLDLPIYLGHNTGLHLGNYARNDGNSDSSTGMPFRPTIDQILANSANFYTPTDLAGTKLKTMVINPGRQLSWGFANPSQGISSTVQNIQGLSSSLQLFNALFGGAQASSADAGAARPPVVDAVLTNYNSLRQSNTRLSAADKQRLDAHIQLLSELQATLNAKLSCSIPPTPKDDADHHTGQDIADGTAAGQLWCDVIAAAFSCDASRIGVFGWGDTSNLSSYTGTDWHHDVAHMWDMTMQQGLLTQSYQNFFEKVFLYLATKLDSMDDAAGGTVLDNTLMAWSQECCMATHDQFGMQIVTAGGGAGAFNTGLYCDYRQMNASAIKVTGPNAGNNLPAYTTYPGLLYSQWLGTVLQGMGASPSEYELWKSTDATTEGYGLPLFDSTDTWDNAYAAWKSHYQGTTSEYYTQADNFLPFLKPS